MSANNEILVTFLMKMAPNRNPCKIHFLSSLKNRQYAIGTFLVFCLQEQPVVYLCGSAEHSCFPLQRSTNENEHTSGLSFFTLSTSHRICTWLCCALFCCGYRKSSQWIHAIFFIHIFQGCFTGTGTILRSNSEEYGYQYQYQTTNIKYVHLLWDILMSIHIAEA